MKSTALLLTVSIIIGLSAVIIGNYTLTNSSAIQSHSILTKPELLQKFKDGYTEVCFRDIVNPNNPDSPVVRTCLLDADIWEMENGTPFYIRMKTDDFCAYRYHETDSYYKGHKAFGKIYDGKTDGVCHIPFELNWERRTWDMSYVQVDELDKEFIYMVFYKPHR